MFASGYTSANGFYSIGFAGSTRNVTVRVHALSGTGVAAERAGVASQGARVTIDVALP